MQSNASNSNQVFYAVDNDNDNNYNENNDDGNYSDDNDKIDDATTMTHNNEWQQ